MESAIPEISFFSFFFLEAMHACQVYLLDKRFRDPSILLWTGLALQDVFFSGLVCKVVGAGVWLEKRLG